MSDETPTGATSDPDSGWSLPEPPPQPEQPGQPDYIAPEPEESPYVPDAPGGPNEGANGGVGDGG